MAEKTKKEMDKTDIAPAAPAIINCLEKRSVIVRSLVKNSNLYKDPNHIMHGHHETFEAGYVTPVLSNGSYVNVLTNEEKACLEKALGRDLSVYAKTDNIWDETKVVLRKGDNKFDLSKPMDYIKYKILLANKNEIAPSVSALNDRPKSTYNFVVIEDREEKANKLRQYTANQKANRLLGKYEDDRETLITLLEILSGRPVSSKVATEDILVSLDEYVSSDAKLFVKIAEDPLLKAKSLIRRAVAASLIGKRGDFYFRTDTNAPLCEDGQDPTLSVAAAFISDPHNAEYKYSLEKKLSL